MTQTFKTLFRSFFILILPLYSLFFVACEEEPSGIGIDLKLPDQRLDVFFSDTNKIQAYTFTQDSIRSDEPIYSLLGTINDPVFGTANASFLTQILLSEKLYPGENVKVDSFLFIIKPFSLFYSFSYILNKSISFVLVSILSIQFLLLSTTIKEK